MVEFNSKVLEVKNLKTYFYLDEGILKAVDGVSFCIGEGEITGIIGESGCGKSITALSIMRIIPPSARTTGEINFRGKGRDVIDITKLRKNGKELRNLRGKEISMIFQEPMTSLSPVHTIGNQIMEMVFLHETRDKAKAREITIEMLNVVGIPNPTQRINEYPHQLSGGMRQRAMIAMALCCDPSLLIADEPTTALDVTIQAQILNLIQNLQEQFGMSILYISHNLDVIAEISDEVMVMYLGKIVEYTNTREIFKNSLHPYTDGLLKSIPKIGRKARVRLDTIRGTVPIPLNQPQECGFYSRCSKAMKGICDKNVPALVEIDKGHFVRCFLYGEGKDAYDKQQ